MIDRNKLVVGLFAVLAAASAIGFGIMFTYVGRDSCLDGSGTAGGSCPALAEVNGMRYEVSVASELVGLEADLVPFAPIGRTNVSNDFADPVTFRIANIDPTAVLASPARSTRAQDVAPYRLLFGPNRERAYPFLCSYFPEARLVAEELCGAPA